MAETDEIRTRYVLFEKYDGLDKTGLNLENTPELQREKVIFAVNNLGQILEFVSEDAKETLISNLLGNSEYGIGDDGNECLSFDIYDWNDYCLYYEFAKYKKTRKNPIITIKNDSVFNDDYFGQRNIEEFNKFINGDHEVFMRPI